MKQVRAAATTAQAVVEDFGALTETMLKKLEATRTRVCAACGYSTVVVKNSSLYNTTRN